MDYSDGRGSPAYLQPVEISADNTAASTRADFGPEANLGSPMRRLESDLGLPSGFLAIHECGAQQQVLSQERQNAAPYYPQEETRPNPGTGTIPDMRQAPQYAEQSTQPQPYADQRPQQKYADQRGFDPGTNAPASDRYAPPPSPQFEPRPYVPAPPVERSQYRPVDNYVNQQLADERQLRYPVQQQFVDPGYMSPEEYREQQRWIDQQRYANRDQYIDQRSYVDQRRNWSPQRMVTELLWQSQRPINREYYQQQQYYQGDGRQQWWEESRYPSNANQRYVPSRNPQIDQYRRQWWDQSQNPSDQRYYPSRNPDLDARRQQWWEQSNYPTDSRYIPGRNPDLDSYRQRWWQNSQTPPYSYDRTVPTQQPVPIERDPRYYPGDQQLQNFATAINSFLGHSVTEYDRTVPSNLGCARAVSLVLERAYGLPIREQSNARLEEAVKYYGWEQIDPQNIQTGDLIIASREPGKKGHSAIYLGNDQIFNNNSNSGVMQIESAGKFRSKEFVSVRVYRKTR